MDPIDSVSRAMQLLRVGWGRAARPAPASGRSEQRCGAEHRAATGAHPRKYRVAVQMLDAGDARYSERATEAFVEGLLLDGFGAEMINDVQFRQLILGVAREMRAEHDTARELDQLFRSVRLARSGRG